MFKRVLILFCLVFATSAEEFLSQDYVDTTVTRAFYAFVAANKGAGGEYTQETAIRKAKQTVSMLRKKAETDPNKRYILWRISELESQILLEEEEVEIKNQYKRVQEINKLVNLFNKELDNKGEPSFGTLHAIHATMTSIDVNHANELADLINGHNRYISQELRSRMRQHLNSKNYSKAEKEYAYAIKNRRYLNISEYDLNFWGAKIQQKQTADYLKKNLGKQLSDLEDLARDNALSRARRSLEILTIEVSNASKHHDRSFVSRARTKVSTMGDKLVRIEDSLVAYNISLIKQGDTDPAIRYMNKTLRPAGVVPEKVAKVDRAIIAAGGERQLSGKTQAGVSKEMESFGFSGGIRDQAMRGLKEKIQRKKDSLRRFHDELEYAIDAHFESEHRAELKVFFKGEAKHTKMRNKADAEMHKIRRLLDTGKERKANKRYEKKKVMIQGYGTAKKQYFIRVKLNEYNGVNSSGDAELRRLLKIKQEESQAGREAKAEALVGEVYTALDARGSDAAYDLYYRNRDFLRENAYKSAYNTVRLYVIKEYNKEYRVYGK